jgi:CubicO group peptidase (beta-lactamase class C family)
MIDVEKYVENDYNGCVFLKAKDNFRFAKAYGYADLANKVENNLLTKFPTASAGKAFIAVGILQLIEKGLLSFDDTIGELLDFDLKKIDESITIHNLLAHTSGIPDYFDETKMDEYDELWKDYPNYKIRKSEDLIPLFIDKPMMYPVGEKFQYNNTGYVVLGIIIEKISKQGFDEYLKENIFIPCDMENTGYYELDRLPSNCANAYIYDQERKEYYTNIYSVDVKGTGAGGAFTTIVDVEKFWLCLFKTQLIGQDMLKEMMSPQGGQNYGYGMWLSQDDQNNYIPYFQGCDPGVSFISMYDWHKEVMITIVSNFGDDVWKMKRNLMTLDFYGN